MSGFADVGWMSGVDNFHPFPRHILKMKDSGSSKSPSDNMVLMNWKEFYENYRDEVHELIDYFGEDYYLGDLIFSGKELVFLVDTSVEYNDCMTRDIKRKYKKSAGKKRREKMREHYNYMYLLPRIHGFMMLAEVEPEHYKNHSKYGKYKTTGLEHRKILQLVNITTSRYTDRRGVGTYMLECMKIIAQYSDYTDIVLEVANTIVVEAREFLEFDIKYTNGFEEEIVFSAAVVETAETQKVPGPVKVCTLQAPQFTVVTVPPVAAMNVLPVALLVES